MKKLTNANVRRIAAAAMALTFAVPTVLSMQPVGTKAAETKESVLSKAVKTISFETSLEDEGMTAEGEVRLKVENGKPVINEAGDDYEWITSTALPEIKETADKGKVLVFKDSEIVDQVIKTQSDALDEKYATDSAVQTKEKIGGHVRIAENPFKGMEFDDNDKNAGVTISYWVKVPVIKINEQRDKVTDGTGKDRGANATTIVFQNDDRVVMQRDDYAKHLACIGYDEAKEANDTEALKDYDMGERITVHDKDNNYYVLYRKHGVLVRFNPNYPDKEAEAAASAAAVAAGGTFKGGGWYNTLDYDKEKDAKFEVTDDAGKTYKIASFATGTTPDRNQYELFRYRYGKKDDFENGFSSKSKVKEGKVKGALQISTDNDFYFREDHYRTFQFTGENGEALTKAVAGVKIENPNSDKCGQFQDIGGSNQFFFDGDERVTNLKTGAEKWHYVTVVMQNDWVQMYVDGEMVDAETEYQYVKDLDSAIVGLTHDFSSKNTGKNFNRGKGLRYSWCALGKENIAEWSKEGTANQGPVNKLHITMLDWIAHPDTELFLGGTSYSAASTIDQNYGSIEDVMLDDISFFKTALTEDEAAELYDEVNAGNGKLGDVDGDGQIGLADARMALRAALHLQELTDAQKTAADVDKNNAVDLQDAKKILRVALHLDSF